MPEPVAPAAKSGQAGGVWLVGVVVSLAVAALYLRTAARDIVFGDSPELTGAAITLGVAHPPGYPLWTMLAHVFTLLPIGTLPFRVSLFSVAAALTCVAVVYVTTWRLTRSIAASVAAATLLALSTLFWTWSVVPEVFPLNNALAAGLVALIIEWHRTRRPRYFVAAAFVGGLAMANQQTIALLGPAILWLMWQHRRAFRGGGLFVRAALASVAGLVPYLYLPVAAARNTAWSWSDISSAQDLVGHILRTSYGTAQLVSEGRFQGGSAVDRVGALLASFSPPEAILIACGAVLLYQRERVLFWFFTIAFLVCGPAFTAYSNIDVSSPLTRAVLERFFLLAHVLLAPLTALGVVFVGDYVARSARPLSTTMWRAVVAAAGLMVAIVVAAGSFSAIDQSEDHLARQFAEDILASARPGGILLAGGDPVVMPIGYLRSIEGVRPDLTFVQIPLLRADWYVRQLRRDHPDLILSYRRYDGFPGTMRSFIEPNDPSRFDVIGGLLDDTMSSTHTFVPRGLVSELRPNADVVDPDRLAAENERLLASYRIPTLAAVTGRAWDRIILGDYASPAYNVGRTFEEAKRYAQARDWYTRALTIDPDFSEARAALAKLPK